MRRNDDDGDGRRRVLKGIGGALGAAALGCGSSGQADEAGGAGGAGGAGASSSDASSSRASSSESSSRSSSRASSSSSGGGGGAGGGGMIWTPDALLAPIEHVIVLCMENRSFDHILGSLRLLEHRLDVDGLTGAETNPDANGVRLPIFQLDDFTVESPPHDWDPVHDQWDMGLNDGFVRAFSGPTQQEVMGYHVRSQLPITYALADQAALCDRWFSSVLGPTWPNRFYLHGATSQSTKDNTPVTGFRSIFDLLDDKGVASANYFGDIPWCTSAYFKTSDLHDTDTFLADAMSGNLPPFCIVDPSFFGDAATDDHPDHDVELGEAFVATIIQAVAQSPLWNKCLFVLTFDEHGGFFDHVPPPATFDDDPDFAQLGFRVPALVLGPYVRQGVMTTQLEHCSVIKTMQIKYGLDQVNARVGVTNDLSCCIDPSLFGSPRPLAALPAAPISMRRLRARERTGRIAQPEMWSAVERGVVPRHLDKRSSGFERAERWLRVGADLGAVKLL
ncbi:MAG TPA: alkaline phosphatase family protein [Byssovorax sp.]|jgi:phospholipase C